MITHVYSTSTVCYMFDDDVMLLFLYPDAATAGFWCNLQSGDS